MTYRNFPCLYTCLLLLSTALGSLAHPEHEIGISAQGPLLLASALLHNHPDLLAVLDVDQREWLNGELKKGEKEQDGEIPQEKFHELLEALEAVPTIDLKNSNASISIPEVSFRLRSDRGGLLCIVLLSLSGSFISAQTNFSSGPVFVISTSKASPLREQFFRGQVMYIYTTARRRCNPRPVRFQS